MMLCTKKAQTQFNFPKQNIGFATKFDSKLCLHSKYFLVEFYFVPKKNKIKAIDP